MKPDIGSPNKNDGAPGDEPEKSNKTPGEGWENINS